MDQTKKEHKPSPVCSCGKQSKLVVYSTFEYFYCSACKTEVKEEEKPKKKNPWGMHDRLDMTVPVPPPPAMLYGVPLTQPQPATPAKGLIVAMKGERVVCDTCAFDVFLLPEDLEEQVPNGGRLWSFSISQLIAKASDGTTGCCSFCSNGKFAQYNGALFVKFRGWV